MDYLKLINELNDELYEEYAFVTEAYFYSTDGYTHIIGFGSIELWNSETDDREWVDETNDYEPLKPFLIRELKSYGETLVQITS